MKNRRGVGQIVSWILLLGLAVALGTGIFLWQVRQTEELGSSTIRFASGVMECQNLNFNAYSSKGCTEVTIKNSGYFSIDGFVVRIFSSFGVGGEVKEVFVKAQKSGVLSVGVVDAEKVEVMPVVSVEGELVGCQGRIKEVSCRGLDDIQVEACESADANGNCDLLDDLGIVTCQECCDNLERCCGG